MGLARGAKGAGVSEESMKPAPEAPLCPQCQVETQLGFLLDAADKGYERQLRWQPHEPQEKRVFGLFSMDFVAPTQDARKVVTFRCPRCALLLSYAP